VYLAGWKLVSVFDSVMRAEAVAVDLDWHCRVRCIAWVSKPRELMGQEEGADFVVDGSIEEEVLLGIVVA
jgi:hypothetical protein